jgi:hypothetical protein
MELVVQTSGKIHCIYGEEIDLAALGKVSVTRASHVEPDATGLWLVDFAPIAGPRLGPFSRRSEALAAETAWLLNHWSFLSRRWSA